MQGIKSSFILLLLLMLWAGYNLDRSQVHQRADIQRQTTATTHIFMYVMYVMYVCDAVML